MQYDEISKGVKHIFGNAVILRLCSLSISTILANFISIKWHGVHTATMALFVSITSNVRNDFLRRILRRFPPDKSAGRDVNRELQRMNFFLTLLATLIATYVWMAYPPQLVKTSPSTIRAYQTSMLFHATASILTALADPFYMNCCYAERFHALSRQDSVGGLAFSLSWSIPNILVALSGSDKIGELCMIFSGTSQCVWALTFLSLSIRNSQLSASAIWLELKSIMSVRSHAKLPSDVLSNIKSELWSWGRKTVVGEADKVLLLQYADAELRGAFGIIQSICGVIPRLFFAPQDEMITIHYSRENLSGIKPEQTDKFWMEYTNVLRLIACLECTIGFSMFLFLPTFSDTLLQFIYGDRMSNFGYLLSVYSGILLLWPINGVMESFYNAAAPTRWLYIGQIVQFTTWLIITLGEVAFFELQRRPMQSRVFSFAFLLCAALGNISRLIVPFWMLKSYMTVHFWRVLTKFGKDIAIPLSFVIFSRVLLNCLPRRSEMLESVVRSWASNSVAKRISDVNLFYGGAVIVGWLVFGRYHIRKFAFQSRLHKND